jgi:hypothetical protein
MITHFAAIIKTYNIQVIDILNKITIRFINIIKNLYTNKSLLLPESFKNKIDHEMRTMYH